ncbi:MAG TPA: hypothetical protein VHG32_27860 [Thermoanaerobaculia bacterium]|jgi:hypothetical protein|nr:hypothetical protein [Thermoanaerobaculia bacterium]
MAYHGEAPRGGALRRRDFLAIGSLAALTPLLPRAAAGSSLTGEAAAPATAGAGGTAPAAIRTLPLSIGYLEGSELLSNLRKLQPDLTVLTVQRRGSTFTAGRRMLPAHSFPSGDPALVGGAVRMTIHDLYPRRLPDGPGAERWPQAIDLDVMVPILDPPAGSTARFQAWSYRRLPAEDRSARVSFVLWPDWYSDLGVIMRVVPGGAGSQPHLLQTRFTLGADHGRPRLLKGVYLLGVAPGAWEDDLELPDDPAQLPPEQLSVLMTIEPVGLRRG